MLILSLSLVQEPLAGSWWQHRFGSGTKSAALWAALPVIMIVLAFTVLPWLLHPLLLLFLMAVAVLGPVVGAIAGWVKENRAWQSYAVMGAGIGVVLVTVAVAYGAGAFVFGF
jgi:hypothetical protein